jgi:hypothetical protein
MKATGICSSCGSPMTWAITDAKGRRMPLDPDPVPDGNVWVIDHPEHGAPIVGVALHHDDIPADIETYVAHFVTCTDATSHRRRKR